MSEYQVSNRTAQPSEYAALLGTLEERGVPEGDEEAVSTIKFLQESLGYLSDPQLKRSTYYGFSRAIEHMAIPLLDPDMQEDIEISIKEDMAIYDQNITRSADAPGTIAEHRIAELDMLTSAVGDVFCGLTSKGLQHLSKPEHLLLDALIAAYYDRRNSRYEQSNKQAVMRENPQDFLSGEMCYASWSMRSLATNGLARISHRVYQQKRTVDPQFRAEDFDVTTPQLLYRQCAALSLAEIDSPSLLGRLLVPDSHGNLVIDRRALPEGRERPEGCPALGVRIERTSGNEVERFDVIKSISQWVNFIIHQDNLHTI